MNEPVLVTGSGGVIGPSLTSALAGEDYQVTTLSRRHRQEQHCIEGDLERPDSYDLPGTLHAVVHAAPIWLLAGNLPRWGEAGLSRLIVFSSSSGSSKTDSPSEKERRLAESLLTSEKHCREFCNRHDIAYTIFRPTMIYGYGRDQNISRIASWIRKYRFFPIAGSGGGRRQPVHVDDLVFACLRSLPSRTTHGKTYYLSGGETLTYREMVTRIFAAVGMPPRIIPVPVAMYRMLMQLATRLQLAEGVDPAMADRMEQDLCFDHAEATADFGYAPTDFLGRPMRDLPGAA